MKHKTLLITLLMLIATSAFAQIPQTMSYQGVLTDANGTPVADGPVNLTFKLYDAATDGTMLWEETQQVDVAKGLFNVILGTCYPLNLSFDKPYWLGSTVRTEAELEPRTGLYQPRYRRFGNTGNRRLSVPGLGRLFVRIRFRHRLRLANRRGKRCRNTAPWRAGGLYGELLKMKRDQADRSTQANTMYR